MRKYINRVCAGKRIKELRTEKKMTVKELAELLNVSPRSVWSWERGDRLPTISNLIKMVRLFRRSFDYMTGNDS